MHLMEALQHEPRSTLPPQRRHLGTQPPRSPPCRTTLGSDAMGHNSTWHLSFSLRQRLCEFAGAVNEKPRAGAERAVLEGDDYVLHVGHLQFNGQDLDLRAHGGKSQYGSRENRDKAPGRQETNPHLGGIGNHSRAGIIEPASAKGLYCDRPNHAFRRWQRPRFARQFGKLYPAPPNPLILRARRDDIGVVKEKFEVQSLVCSGAESPYDQEIDVTLAQFTAQWLQICGHEMKHDARIAPGEPIDDGRNEACGQNGGASDPHFPSRRIGEKLDVLHRLAQVIEYGHSAIEQGATVLGRLDALGVALKQSHANGTFQFRD